jgi:hypothetical protein
MPAVKDIAGQRFGRLVVVERIPGSRKSRAKWRCVCDCGAWTEVPTGKLTAGLIRSCGCRRTKEGRENFVRKAHVPLTAERLRELLAYDPETGLFRVLRALPKCQREVGQVIGDSLSKAGYAMMCIEGRRYRAHRLAWLYVTGEWPSNEIDHINGIRNDNRFENLRDVPGRINSQNQRKAKPFNQSGILGATKKRNRWSSAIGINGKTVRLGVFDTPEEAHAAYVKAKRELHEGCTI